MANLDYEADVQIDPSALDVEWLNQPDLMRKYVKNSAEADRDLDNAKEALDVERARLDLDIRDNPEKYALTKTTEGAIASTILQQKSYQNAAKEFTNAKYESNIAKAAVRAIEHRKTALENLVTLLRASYFAGPQMERNLSEENMKREEKRKGNAKVKIARRTK
jgi:hypothetical protein